jgi:iron complex transport system ATP-binding protein
VSVRVRDVSHQYGRVRALESVTADAAPGRITAVLGPNAAGKSTLLRCVIGALSPAAGDVLIDGEPADQLPTRKLAGRVAYVPQRPQVSAAFTVREVVELGRYALAPSRRRVDEALGDLDLNEIADRPFPALSVGQQQRATLARAVAQLADDGHLVLDEPASAMDLRHVRRSTSLLRRLADAGATVLVAMHDLTLAVSLADECWLLDHGRLVVAGPTSEVISVEQLRDVFGVRFEWIERPGGGRVLVAEGE